MLPNKFFNGTFSLLFVIFLVSCKTEGDLLSTHNISEKYEKASLTAHDINKHFLSSVSHKLSRGNVRDDIVGYLLSLDPEELDSLYNGIIEDPNYNEAYTISRLDSIKNSTNLSELVYLEDFICQYIYVGGHSVELMTTFINNSTTDEIADLIISSAANYDNITSPESASLLACNSRTSRSCMIELAIDCGGTAIAIAMTVGEFETGNYGFAVIGCTHDLIDIINAIRRYNRCERFESYR